MRHWALIALFVVTACGKQTPVTNRKAGRPLPPLPEAPLQSTRNMQSMAAVPAPRTFTVEWSNAPVEDGSIWETGLIAMGASNAFLVLPYGTGGIVRVTITNDMDVRYVRAFNRIKGTH